MLKAVIDSLDDVDEKFRGEYVAFDDAGTERFMLDIDTITVHPGAKNLQSAHERTKGRVRELTGQIKTLQDQVDAIPEDFDPDLYERAVTEGVGGGAGGGVKNEAEIRREASEAGKAAAAKAAQKTIDALTKERDTLKGRVEKDTRHGALSTQLDAVGVTNPVYRKAAMALLSGVAKVVEHDGDYEVLAADPDLGDIPVAEYVKTWAGTDEGKAFISPRQSAGGDANGNDTGGNAPTSTANPFKAATFNATEQARIRRENPGLADKLKREAGSAK